MIYANVYKVSADIFSKGMTVIAQNTGDAIAACGRPESEIFEITKTHGNAIVAIERARLDADVVAELARLRETNTQFKDLCGELLGHIRNIEGGVKGDPAKTDKLIGRAIMITRAMPGEE